MLASLLTTVLLATAVLGAPAAHPGYKQTTRQAVTDRLAKRAKGIARRQAASPRSYSRCETSGPAQEGTLYARYTGSINYSMATFGGYVAGTDLDDCTNKCAQRPAICQAVTFEQGGCTAYTNYGQLFPSIYSWSFAGNDCASLAAQYPGIASAACCNYWTPALDPVVPLD